MSTGSEECLSMGTHRRCGRNSNYPTRNIREHRRNKPPCPDELVFEDQEEPWASLSKVTSAR